MQDPRVCVNCGKPVSFTALLCSHCGRPAKKQILSSAHFLSATAPTIQTRERPVIGTKAAVFEALVLILIVVIVTAILLATMDFFYSDIKPRP